jgi:hypothetical protein
MGKGPKGPRLEVSTITFILYYVLENNGDEVVVYDQTISI